MDVQRSARQARSVLVPAYGVSACATVTVWAGLGDRVADQDPSAVASLLRARVGAALRGQPSRLNGRQDPQREAGCEVRADLRIESSRTGGAVGVDAARIAAALSVAAPGLPLMLQLRARAFDDAVAMAPDRGVRLLVSIGNGFDDRPDGVGFPHGRARWEVDYPLILSAKSACVTVERVAARDLDADAWSALRARGAPLASERTLFVVHNAALWSSRRPLLQLLPRFAAEAAAGSEILLNIPDDEEAGRRALGAVAPESAPGGTAALVELHHRIEAFDLETLAAWDTGDLQRWYLGRNDLLVREFFVWIRTHGCQRRVPTTVVHGSGPVSGGVADVASGRRKSRRRIGGGPSASMHALLGHRFSPGSASAVRQGSVEAATSRGSRGGTVVVERPPIRVVVERPPIRVVARRVRMAWAHEVAADAATLLRRIATLLGQSRIPVTLLDVSTTDAHRPEACGDSAESTGRLSVVRIPEPLYTRQILTHELTHVIARSGSAWLSEGLAVWTQRRIAPGPCFPDDAVPAAVGDDCQSAPSLTLSEWLRRPADLSIPLRPVARRPGRREYRRAASFVEFFMRSFGCAHFFRLFAACGRPGFHDATAEVCRSVGCHSLGEIEARWEASTKGRSA